MSLSDDSADEEEVIKNFDEEARIIVQTETLPKKSSERYLLVYNHYKKWQIENVNSLSNSDENNLIVYFNQLKGKLKPPTLWSIWSMLRKTLNMNDNVNIGNFLKSKSMITNNSKGYKPKKSFILRWDQIMQFMTNAPDHIYLAAKVILVFGACGALRCDEITNMKCNDVEDLNNRFLVSFQCNKNDYPGQFIIGSLFYDKVKQYILLRPTEEFSDRFFIQYHQGKCSRQSIGRHKIGEIPQTIASYLNLKDPKRYTGHCFRRTSATLLSEFGANMQAIKQLGRWRSDIIAQGYVQNSLRNRQLIFDGITHQASTTNTYSRPSTSTQTTNTSSKSSTNTTTAETSSKSSTSTNVTALYKNTNTEIDNNLDWLGFSEDFTANDLNSVPSKIEQPSSNKRIFISQSSNNTGSSSLPNNSHLFFTKPPLKLKFIQPTAQPSPKNRNKCFEKNELDIKDKNNNINTLLKAAKFKNCTFTNCTFNIKSCQCEDNKEN